MRAHIVVDFTSGYCGKNIYSEKSSAIAKVLNFKLVWLVLVAMNIFLGCHLILIIRSHDQAPLWQLFSCSVSKLDFTYFYDSDTGEIR